MTPAQFKQMQRTADSAGLLALLELRHITWTQPVRINSDTRQWTSNGAIYAPAGFSFKLPDQADNHSAPTNLVMNNVGREIVAALESLPPGAIIEASLVITTRADPNMPIQTIESDMIAAQCTTTQVQATLSSVNRGGRSVVRLRFDPQISPGVFSQ